MLSLMYVRQEGNEEVKADERWRIWDDSDLEVVRERGRKREMMMMGGKLADEHSAGKPQKGRGMGPGS